MAAQIVDRGETQLPIQAKHIDGRCMMRMSMTFERKKSVSWRYMRIYIYLLAYIYKTTN